jgi:uncharacterized membrane protein
MTTRTAAVGELDPTAGEGLTTDEREELRRLRREVKSRVFPSSAAQLGGS